MFLTQMKKDQNMLDFSKKDIEKRREELKKQSLMKKMNLKSRMKASVLWEKKKEVPFSSTR